MPGWDAELASRSTLTFDLKLAVHLSFTQVVNGLAGVHAAIIGAGLPYLQSTHSLVAKHAVAWIINDDYLVLHPDNFRLQQIICILELRFNVYLYIYIDRWLAPVSPTYPWVGTDAAVQSSIVASYSKRINQWLCELRSLFEVTIFEILHFHLQTCMEERNIFCMIQWVLKHRTSLCEVV